MHLVCRLSSLRQVAGCHHTSLSKAGGARLLSLSVPLRVGSPSPPMRRSLSSPRVLPCRSAAPWKHRGGILIESDNFDQRRASGTAVTVAVCSTRPIHRSAERPCPGVMPPCKTTALRDGEYVLVRPALLLGCQPWLDRTGVTMAFGGPALGATGLGEKAADSFMYPLPTVCVTPPCSSLTCRFTATCPISCSCEDNGPDANTTTHCPTD